MAVIETIAVSYISIHTAIFIATFCLIARSNLQDGASLCSKAFFNKLRQTFTQRPTLAAFSILHFVDVGLDFGVMFGWYFEQNTFRKIISYNGSLLLFMIILHTISKITSSLYIYGVTREILPTILQFFDLEIYYEMYFDQNCTEMNMDIKIEQLYRSFAVMQSFPISIIQTYLLVAYQLVDTGQFLDSSDFTYISLTFISLLSSILCMISLQTNHDAKFLNTNDKWMNVGMPKWLIRVLFRTFELLSRILLLTYILILYGIISIIIILILEWIFQIYNHYKKERYDNSSEHSIRMWRKQNKFFLWPLVMDEIISFWNFDWKLPASNPPKQRSFDIIDILQCWTLASFLYGNKSIRKLTTERPPCDCKRPMNEYWTTAFDPAEATHAQQISASLQVTNRKLKLVNDGSTFVLDRNNVIKPKCSSCNQYVAIKSHYFRCPTFLQSGNIDEETETQKITKHGRYLCIECGYARMTYVPFLFVLSRNIFTWIYIGILTIFASLLKIKCNVLCIDDGTLNNIFHDTAYKSLLFLFGIGCNILSPIFFTLILTTKQMKSRQIETKSFSGKVVQYARKLQWNKVYELIRHEECDVNEVDRMGRNPLLYAAISHNFQVIRDLQQFGADMDHKDINSCGITQYLNNYKENNNGNEYDDDIEKNDKLTGPTRAAKNGSEHDMHLCIELNCNLNKKDGYGHTSLLIACKEREIGIIKILIQLSNKYGDEKCNLNLSDEHGRTAIIIVTQYGYDDLLQILLNEANGIDVTHRDNEGTSAFEHAISCNQKQCAKLIHQYKKQNNIVETERPSKKKQKIESDSNDISDIKVENMEMKLTDNNDLTEKKINIIPRKISTDSAIKQIKLPKQLTPDVYDNDIQGDDKKHPILIDANTPISGINTPSQNIELHESDSIDRRMIRALTVENNQLAGYGNDEIYDDDDDDIGKRSKKKTISIIVTDTSAEH